MSVTGGHAQFGVGLTETGFVWERSRSVQTAAGKLVDGRRLTHLSAGRRSSSQRSKWKARMSSRSWLGQPQALSLLDWMMLPEPEQSTQKG